MKPYRGKEKAPGLLKSNANHPLTNTPIAHDRGHIPSAALWALCV